MGLRCVRVDPEGWELDGDMPGRALPRAGDEHTWGLVVAGCHLHVYAVQVTIDDEGQQVSVNDAFARELEFAQDQAQEPVDTVRLPGLPGEWVVLAEPAG